MGGQEALATAHKFLVPVNACARQRARCFTAKQLAEGHAMAAVLGGPAGGANAGGSVITIAAGRTGTSAA
jgi:hypothetical protein